MSPLQRRILTMTIPPVLVLLLLVPWLIMPRLEDLHRARKTEEIVDLLGSGPRQLHEALIQERTLTASFLAEGKVEGISTLQAARTKTDELRQKIEGRLAEVADDRLRSILGEALEKLSGLTDLRARVDRYGLSPVQAIAGYDPFVLGWRRMWNDLVAQAATVLDPDLASALLALAELHGAMGSEIAYGAILVHQGFFEPEAFRGYIGVRGRQNRLVETIQEMAERGGRNELRALLSTLRLPERLAMQAALERAAETRKIEGVDLGRWFALGQMGVDSVRAAEQALFATLIERADAFGRERLTIMLLMLAAASGVLGLSGFLTVRGVRAVGRLEDEERQARAAAEAERRRASEELARRFEAEFGVLVSGLRELARGLEEHAHSVEVEAQAAGEESLSTAESGRRTSGNVGTIAAACEELAASAREIASQIARSSGMTREIAGRVQQTDRTMGELAAMAEQIGQIVGLIADIAEKTNLLALNATIEAARAGEAGRGFAVVAQEVKSLAGQTAEATRRIAAQVETVQTATRGAVGAIEEVRRAMDDLDRIAAAVAAAVEEQNGAIADVARNAQEAAGGTEEIARRAGAASDKVQQARQRSAAMSRMVAETVARTGELEARLRDLLASIRAAA
ncbi:Methyl-accepting chemotaxis protein PctA [bacterium HR40]|nr:Methyl-accepting chemotaxis protein PctA [bacterium HR40]